MYVQKAGSPWNPKSLFFMLQLQPNITTFDQENSDRPLSTPMRRQKTTPGLSEGMWTGSDKQHAVNFRNCSGLF